MTLIHDDTPPPGVWEEIDRIRILLSHIEKLAPENPELEKNIRRSVSKMWSELDTVWSELRAAENCRRNKSN